MMQSYQLDHFSWWHYGADLLEALVVVTLQATVAYSVFRTPVKPDLVFLYLAHKTLTRDPIPVFTLAVIAGLFQDALNPVAYTGMNLLGNLCLVALISLVSNSIPRERKLAPFVIIVLAGSALRNLIISVLLWIKGMQGFGYLLKYTAFSALYTTIIAFVILGIFSLTRTSMYERPAR